MRKLFLDLDQVFADFHSFAYLHSGHAYQDGPKAIWAKLDKIDRMFKKLRPFEGAKHFFDILYGTGKIHLGEGSVEILTALPLRTGTLMTASADKISWVREHLSKDIVVNCVPGWEAKKYYCQPGDILIDDMLRNCEDWTNAGGIAIQHLDMRDTLNQLHEVLNASN